MIGDVHSLLNGDVPRAAAGREKDDQSHSIGPLSAVNKKSVSRKSETGFKKPEGMNRELFNLMSGNDNKEILSIMPTEIKKGYRNPKAQVGLRAVRKYKWVPFDNEARTDGLKLCHWQRVDLLDTLQEYPFAQFNKVVDIPVYSSVEYEKILKSSKWTKEETDYLFELCRRFDLRWVIVHDRYDRSKFGHARSIEDMKERFYAIVHELTQAREPSAEPICYDAEHERRRKEQLNKQWHRTQDEVEEEEELVQHLKTIEARRKEREKKAQDLQKLINMTEAPTSPPVSGTMSPSLGKKKSLNRQKVGDKGPSLINHIDISATSIRYPEFKSAGAHFRSHEMKLPTNVGQKKLKNIEAALEKCKMEMNPMGTEAIVSVYNEFRSHVMLLQELKSSLQNAEFELETLRTKLGEDFTIEPRMRISEVPEGGLDESAVTGEVEDPTTTRAISSLLDVSTVVNPVIQVRRRRTAASPSSLRIDMTEHSSRRSSISVTPKEDGRSAARRSTTVGPVDTNRPRRSSAVLPKRTRRSNITNT